MPRSLPLSERIKAIRRHPGMFKKGAYIFALVALISGTLSQIFSAKNWASIGNAENALGLAWAAAIVAIALGLGKKLLRDSLSSDDGEIVQIGLNHREATESAPAPWRLTSTRIVALCAAAAAYAGAMVISNDKLLSRMDHSPQSVIRRNATATCKIASDIHSGRISDPGGALARLNEAHENLTGLAPSMESQALSFNDRAIFIGSLQMNEISQQMLKGEIDIRSEQAKDYFAKAMVACEMLKDY
jgi:hypothetical protein